MVGPWGGGNKTVSALAKVLSLNGHDVVYSLWDGGIDVLFCFDPRPNHCGEDYSDILNYRSRFGGKIIQRVGDLGTHGKPELTYMAIRAMQFSDFVIFPSEWAHQSSKFKGKNYSIIHNAPLEAFYEFRNLKPNNSKLQLITHHWSTNPKKGFQYYELLDRNLVGEFCDFTYVGRLPSNFKFKNSTHIEATGDISLLSQKLSNSDLYITASEEEAGANHVLEAMAAGLPVVYHSNGGSIRDYCKGYGVEFDSRESLLRKVKYMSNNLGIYAKRVEGYQNKIQNVMEEYMGLICDIS